MKYCLPPFNQNYFTKLVFCFYLQLAGNADCGGRSLPVFRMAPQPHPGGGGHEFQFGVGDHEFAAAAEDIAIASRPWVEAANPLT